MWVIHTPRRIETKTGICDFEELYELVCSQILDTICDIYEDHWRGTIWKDVDIFYECCLGELFVVFNYYDGTEWHEYPVTDDMIKNAFI